MEYPTVDEWKMSNWGTAEEYNDANIYSLIRLTWKEVSRVAWAALSLVLVLFSAVQVAARLAEYLLDVVVEIVEDRSRCNTSRNVLRLTVAFVSVWFIGLLYWKLLVCPVYEMVRDSTASIARVCPVGVLTRLK